ncbi:MAG: hypothetical protein ACRDCK_11235, partial [Plesiomonas shigelloides]
MENSRKVALSWCSTVGSQHGHLSCNVNSCQLHSPSQNADLGLVEADAIVREKIGRINLWLPAA